MTASPWTKSEWDPIEHLQPASAEDETGDHERGGERQEAAPSEPGNERSSGQEDAEDEERSFEELDSGGDGWHRASVSEACDRPGWLR